ncbi:MAG: hypothetical protein LKE29_11305 [Acidaminococcaceae bacterium]|jgi:hypothetical protein|nr:hypothetical protein [Acidaminococcaceae bacterium]
MKKLLGLIFALFLLCSAVCAAEKSAGTTFSNAKYGFTLSLPKEFTAMKADAPFSLAAFTNEKMFLHIKYIEPQGKYTGDTFGTVTKEEIDEFIKRQRFVAAVNTNKFAYMQHDTNKTTAGFPYLWALFQSDMDMGGTHIKTFMLKNYFYHKNIIIEVDFIIPDSALSESTHTIDAIVNTMKFDNK